MRAVIAALALLAQPAYAHVRAAHEPAPGWTFDAWVVGPLLLTLAWYGIGWLRLRARGATGGTRAHWFWLGWTLLAAALVTPLHEAGERSFSAHMVEHELLMLVAAPLLVLARPVGVALHALPDGARRALVRGAHGRAWSTTWAWLTDAIVATVLQAVALWAWHMPALFDLALARPGWHVAQHVSFLATALLFWRAVLDAPRERSGTAVAALFATSIVSGVLGAAMALSASPWYAGYAALHMAPFGLTPAEDQQLAGLLMWVPGGLVHAGAALALLARSLRAPEVGRAALD